MTIIQMSRYGAGGGGGGGRQPSADTIAYWDFDGTYTDYTGNYSLTTAPASYDTLDSGLQVAYFNTQTTGSNCAAGLGPAMYAPLKDLTISFWINIKSFNSNNEARILYVEGTESMRYSYIQFKPGQIEYDIGCPDGSGTGHFSTTNNTDEWYHICVTYDAANDTMHTYKNGVEISLTSRDRTGPNVWSAGSGNKASVAKGFGGSGNQYKYVSRMIIESKMWSSQEVSNYFNQTKSLYGIS